LSMDAAAGPHGSAPISSNVMHSMATAAPPTRWTPAEELAVVLGPPGHGGPNGHGGGTVAPLTKTVFPEDQPAANAFRNRFAPLSEQRAGAAADTDRWSNEEVPDARHERSSGELAAREGSAAPSE